MHHGDFFGTGFIEPCDIVAPVRFPGIFYPLFGDQYQLSDRVSLLIVTYVSDIFIFIVFFVQLESVQLSRHKCCVSYTIMFPIIVRTYDHNLIETRTFHSCLGSPLDFP